MHGYTYLLWKNKYQLYRIINEQKHVTAVIINLSRQQELADYLTKNFNAKIEPTSEIDILYEIYFNNLEDTNKAIDYLNSLVIIDKLQE